ncbi:MAG: hypothetical protein QXW80_02950 [Candidatus Micrarchaeia archaeon]
MYNYEKLKTVFRKYVLDFELDAYAGAIGPGQGVAPEYSYQCIEGEYMKAYEYDDLIQDPTYFFLTKYFLRVFVALHPFSKLPPFTNVFEMYGGFTPVDFVIFGMPDVQAALKALMEVGNEALNWIGLLLLG